MRLVPVGCPEGCHSVLLIKRTSRQICTNHAKEFNCTVWKHQLNTMCYRLCVGHVCTCSNVSYKLCCNDSLCKEHSLEKHQCIFSYFSVFLASFSFVFHLFWLIFNVMPSNTRAVCCLLRFMNGLL